MTKNWRPKEGWSNPYHYEGHLPAGGLTNENLLRVIEEQSHVVYEAGADAMLEALKKAASETIKNQPHGIDWREILIYLLHNRIIIIPDEV